MLEMLEILQELAEKAAKDLPEDVVSDLKELSRLQADVHRCLMANKIIDTSKIKRINELVRKHFYHGKPEEKTAINTFDFGEAIRRVKGDARVARKGWNGKGMFVMHCGVDGEDYTLDDGTKVIRRDYLYMKAADDTVVPWVASQTDILAEDWYEVKKEDLPCEQKL